jgi:hypothetical protein
MSLRRMADHGLDDRNGRLELGECTEHAWRIRDVTFALPGAYVCEVCERCGALQIDGPQELAGIFGEQPEPFPSTRPPQRSPQDDGSQLASLVRRWSPGGASPPLSRE